MESRLTTRHFYDGQMMQEEDLTRTVFGEDEPTYEISGRSYALGSRGVDRILPWTWNGTNRVYPMANNETVSQ